MTGTTTAPPRSDDDDKRDVAEDLLDAVQRQVDDEVVG